MPSRRTLVTLALIAVLALGLSACGSSSSSSSTGGTTTSHVSAPKTKFLFHAGLAFGAFHHFIYKPFKAGDLTGGVFSHKFKKVEAGLAGLFAYHEIKLALVDAQSSPLLSRLLSPLTALTAKLQTLGTSLKGGSVDPAAIEATNTQAALTSAASSAAGQPIADATPSAAQLAGG